MDRPEFVLPKEWDEIVEAPGFRELWDLPERFSGPALSALAFGAKFFIDMRERDAYAGDVFIVQRIDLSHPSVMLLRSEDGKMRIVDHAPGASLSVRPWGLAA